MLTQDRTAEFFNLIQSLPPPPPPSSSKTTTNHTNNNYNTDASSQSHHKQTISNITDEHDDPKNELKSFHNTASIISKEIYLTSTLLSQLTSLIHSRSASLFVDDTPQINDLVLRIKSNIESLNVKLDAAQSLIQRNKKRLGKDSQVGMEASNVVETLKEEFMNTTQSFKHVLQERTDKMKQRNDREQFLLSGGDSDGNRGVDSWRDGDRVSLLGNKPKVYTSSSSSSPTSSSSNLIVTGNRSNRNPSSNGLQAFSGKMVEGPRLDLTSAIMSQIQPMMEQEPLTGLPRPYGIKHSDGTYPYTSSSQRPRLRHSVSAPQEIQGSLSTTASIQSHTAGNPNSLPVYTPLDLQMMEEASGQSELMQLIPNQNYLRERADAMSAVESNIAELGTIFNKLAVMVNEHSEMIHRVEDNVDEANDNIIFSMNTLMDTLNNLRSNRQLFFRVMAVLVIFIITFITFFA